MKACCLFNKTYPGTVTAWSLPKVEDNERDWVLRLPKHVLQAFSVLEISISAACSYILNICKHYYIQTDQQGANLSASPLHYWQVKGIFLLAVMLGRGLPACMRRIIVWNGDSQRTILSLSAGVWSVCWHWEKLKGRGWAGNKLSNDKGRGAKENRRRKTKVKATSHYL